MNRRLFLGTLLGAGAGLALPSEVWPFRKIFLPFFRRPFSLPPFAIIHPLVPETIFPQSWAMREAAIHALELENIREQIPDLLLAEHTFYERMRHGGKWPPLRPEIIFEPASIEDRPVAHAANQVLQMIRKSGNAKYFDKAV